MTRSHEQIRLEAAWHEAGHAVAMYLQGTEIDHLELMRPDEIRTDGLAGCVQSAPHPIALSQMSVFGLGPFFWSLVVGTLVSLLFERDGWRELHTMSATVDRASEGP